MIRIHNLTFKSQNGVTSAFHTNLVLVFLKKIMAGQSSKNVEDLVRKVSLGLDYGAGHYSRNIDDYLTILSYDQGPQASVPNTRGRKLVPVREPDGTGSSKKH
ncbi:hypothetical protein TNCV_3269531 [Trichonephila clavipes]|nr:hypothetical protein TNCV_3269531 [Trichonephila clavipes]